MRKSRIIDSHAHVVQYIAGTGAGGELRQFPRIIQESVLYRSCPAASCSFIIKSGHSRQS